MGTKYLPIFRKGVQTTVCVTASQTVVCTPEWGSYFFPVPKVTRDSFPRYTLTHGCDHVERKAVQMFSSGKSKRLHPEGCIPEMAEIR